MSEKLFHLTAAEWNLMECFWDSSPRTGREAVDYLQKSEGWSRSTTLTVLRRMTEKGLLTCEREGEVLRYRPMIRREDAVRQETRSFLDRVYKGSVSMLVSAMTDEQKLSRDEIDRLYEILRRAEEQGK